MKINSFSTAEISACANEHKLKYDMDTSKQLRIFIIISPIINFFPTNLIITNILMFVNRNFNKKTGIFLWVKNL